MRNEVLIANLEVVVLNIKNKAVARDDLAQKIVYLIDLTTSVIGSLIISPMNYQF